MDKWGWFFGWVGVVALFLVIPLNILSNALTPKFMNWWATTSRMRRERRIEQLEIEIKRLNSCLDPDVRNEQLLSGLRLICYSGIVYVYLFLVVPLMLAFLLSLANGDHTTPFPFIPDIDFPTSKASNHAIYFIFVSFAFVICVVLLQRATYRFRMASKVYVATRLASAKGEVKRLVDNSPGQSK